jgi:hypothetical protein
MPPPPLPIIVSSYGPDWLSTNSPKTPQFNRFFGGRTYDVRNIGYMMKDVLLLGKNPLISVSGMINDYEFSF